MRKNKFVMNKPKKRTTATVKKDVPFKSKHNLMFEVAEWEMSNDFQRFRIGTCTRLFGVTDESYDILAIENSEKGNGHFEDVLQWFERSCIRDKRSFRILEVWNTDLKLHLIHDRGFARIENDGVEKTF